MVLKKKQIKKVLTAASILLIFVAVTNTAGAYSLHPGKLSKGIKNQTYYVGLTNSRYSNACVAGVNNWNYAVQNTPLTSSLGFSFTKSSKITGSTIRFWGEKLAVSNAVAVTKYYNIDSSWNAVPVTNHGNRDYADVIFNLNVTDSNASVYNTTYLTSTAGHEIGHALGLYHNENDNGTLMYPYHNTRTAHSPTYDEVQGIWQQYK